MEHAKNDIEGFDLQLMSWGDGSGVPTSGQSFVILGTDDNGQLHSRIFDTSGKLVTDTDETKLPRNQDKAIETLKQQLQDWLPPHMLTDADKAQALAEASSIVGLTRIEDCSKSEYPHQILVRTIGEYMAYVDRLQDEWEEDEENIYLSSAWLRGVSKCSYNLIPSFYRFARRYPGTKEDDLRDEFTRRAHPLLEQKVPSDHWEWYFLMQHYGLPTRLLDWSVSSLVGLYFAVFDYGLLKADWTKTIDEEPQCDAAVWMMDPEMLNKQKLGGRFDGDEPILRYDNEELTPYLMKRPFDKPDWPSDPVAILPAYTNRRLVAQKGTFVLFGDDPTPLDKKPYWIVNGKPRLIQFIIAKEDIPRFRSDLLNAGMTAALLFPELPMLCTDILHNWSRQGFISKKNVV